jgi:hypothetical protein
MNLKQRDLPVVGKYIGAFVNVLYLTMPLLGIMAYTISALTLYTVNINWIRSNISWLSIPVYFVLIIIFCLLLMLLNYKYLYPSYYTFLNKQAYIHNNPIQKDLALIKKAMNINEEK